MRQRDFPPLRCLRVKDHLDRPAEILGNVQVLVLAQDGGRRADHGAQLQGRLAGPEFLYERQQRGQHHHQRDDDRPLDLAGGVVDDGQSQQ
jgi:hypothetical protein